jgi:hypothetical protein
MKTKSFAPVLLVCTLLGATAPLVHAQTIAEALDLAGGVWTTNGTVPWVSQTAVTHDSVDALGAGFQTPFGGSYENAQLVTVVNGPGTISFWWKTSNTTNAAGYTSGTYLNFSTEGEYPYYSWANLSGNSNWNEVVLPVHFHGPNTLTWSVARYYAYELGQDGAWIDEVRFVPSTPIPPSITNQPQTQTSFAGGSAKFSVGMDGTPPFNYQWRFNASPILDATNSALSLKNITLANAGNYDVVITNALGSRTSVAATLTVLPAISVAAALDAPDLTWFTSGDGLWFGQTNTTHDGVDALQTGGSDAYFGDVLLSTTVIGPGNISFWWMCEFFPGFSFEITNSTGSVYSTNIFHITDWNQPSIDVGEGPHTLMWKFWTSPHGGHGEFDSKAVVDQVVWTGGGAPPAGPRLVSLGMNPQGKFAFSFQSQSGKHYYAEYKNSLTDLGWTPLSDFDGNGGVMTVPDPATPIGPRFYRIRTQ